MPAASVMAALDTGEAWWGIRRDVSELLDGGWVGWIGLGFTLGLPLAALVLVFLRRWLALVPLVESLGLFALWFLYYATDWWSNPGQGGGGMVLVALLVGWLFVLVAALRGSPGRPTA